MQIEQSESFYIPNYGGDVPKDILVLKWGYNATVKGPIYLTKKSANEIIKNYNLGGRLLVWDKEHGTELKDAPLELRKAVGVFRPEIKEDGIWFVDCLFNKETEEEIKNGSWLFLSPALRVSKYKIAKSISSSAITNRPGTIGIKPLLLSNENMDTTSQLYLKMQPLKKLHYTAAQLMNDLEFALENYKDFQMEPFSQDLTTALPEWLENIAEMIEHMDPNGETEMDTEKEIENKTMSSEPEIVPPQETMETMSEPEEDSTDYKSLYSEIIGFCQTLTGKQDWEEIKGTIRAYKYNEEAAEKKIALSESDLSKLMIKNAIQNGKIPAAEEKQLLSLSPKELKVFLSRVRQFGEDDLVNEKAVVITGKESTDYDVIAKKLLSGI